MKPKMLISKALELNPVDRFVIIEALVRSLDIPDTKVEKIWTKEAEKRLQAYKEGKLKTISFEDMLGEASS